MLAGFLAGAVEPDALRAIFAPGAPVTPGYRFVQFAYGLQVGEYKSIDRTTARGLLALRDAGGKLSRDALDMILTGKVRGTDLPPNTRGVSLTRLDSIVGRVGRGTSPTQISRSFGRTGFARALGVTGGEGREIALNMGNPVTARFFALIDGATDSQLRDIGGGKGSEE